MLQAVTVSSPDWLIGFFSLPNPSSRKMALGSTQPLTEMSTWKLLDNLTAQLWADCQENVGTSTSQNPMDIHGLLQG
jgi:hypothetical protein